MKLNYGFTLVELLVVIAVVSILLSVGTVTFSTAQKKARDAKRKDDLKVIQQSMEQYYSICGYNYPTLFPGGIICASPSVAILPTLPVDPRSTTPYPTSTSTSSSYQICATLESETVTNYCVTNQQ